MTVVDVVTTGLFSDEIMVEMVAKTSVVSLKRKVLIVHNL